MEKNESAKIYIEKYSKQSIKELLFLYFWLSFCCFAIPLIITFFISDTYSSVKGLEIIQASIYILFALYSFSMLLACFLKERRKLTSLFILESSQFFVVFFFMSGFVFLFSYLLKSMPIRILLLGLYLLGLLKVYTDLKKKKDRSRQSDKILIFIEKYGAILFLISIVIRWIQETFISEQTKPSILLGVIFLILFIFLQVFLYEYILSRILTIISVLRKPEEYRDYWEITKQIWYGSKSKEYKKEQALK